MEKTKDSKGNVIFVKADENGVIHVSDAQALDKAPVVAQACSTRSFRFETFHSEKATKFANECKENYNEMKKTENPLLHGLSDKDKKRLAKNKDIDEILFDADMLIGWMEAEVKPQLNQLAKSWDEKALSDTYVVIETLGDNDRTRKDTERENSLLEGVIDGHGMTKETATDTKAMHRYAKKRVVELTNTIFGNRDHLEFPPLKETDFPTRKDVPGYQFGKILQAGLQARFALFTHAAGAQVEDKLGKNSGILVDIALAHYTYVLMREAKMNPTGEASKKLEMLNKPENVELIKKNLATQFEDKDLKVGDIYHLLGTSEGGKTIFEMVKTSVAVVTKENQASERPWLHRHAPSTKKDRVISQDNSESKSEISKVTSKVNIPVEKDNGHHSKHKADVEDKAVKAEKIEGKGKASKKGGVEQFLESGTIPKKDAAKKDEPKHKHAVKGEKAHPGMNGSV